MLKAQSSTHQLLGENFVFTLFKGLNFDTEREFKKSLKMR